VSVWNRTAERAQALAEELEVAAVEAPVTADLVVNATSVGLQPGAEIEELPLAWIEPPQIAVELVYGEHETPFARWAEAAGAELVDGLEVLVRQGALSFERWTGQEPPIDVMRRAARASSRN
jgi:shikimate dehydrogenase